MRTLMLLGNLDIGGAERTALELAVGLRREGMDVRAAALKSGGPLGLLLRQSGVPLQEGLLKFRFDATASLRVAKLLRRDRFDAIVLVDIYRNAMFCGLWGARLVRAAGQIVRTVLWCSAVPTGQAGDFTPRLRRYLRRGMLDHVVCVSDWQREMLRTYGLPAEKMTTIHNGVDLSRFANASSADLPGPADVPAMVQIANVMPDKDYDTLLSAAALLRRRGVSFRLLLVGRETDAAPMRARIAEGGLTDCVFPLGPRNDVPNLLAASELLVLSTRSEVFNVAVLEAMAAGRAVIVSDVPGFAEMFVDGREGLKVLPGDPAALADAMERLLRDDSFRRQLAAAGRQRGRQFSRETMCNEFARYLKGGKENLRSLS